MPAPRTRKPAVDKTVENQEHPISSETERPSTEVTEEETPVAKMAPAFEVDETVENQMNPGINMVDRSEPVLVEDGKNGVTYDLSKSAPEIYDPEKDGREAEKNFIRQNEAALKGPEREKDSSKHYVTIEFVSTGLTAFGKVWKKGEVHTFVDEDDAKANTVDIHGKSWLDLTAREQEERYGRVMFERR